jgi:molecular chaperone GrpE
MSLSTSDKGTHKKKTPQEDQSAPAPAAEAPAELTQAQQELQDKTKEAEENYARLLRLAADMENLKKRQEKERADLVQFANENLIKELLPVVDNLERALEHGRQLEAPEALLAGIDMVYQGFLKALGNYGVASLTSVGQPFDPAFHNAVMQEENSAAPDCSVTKELQKGYLMHQRLLRPAMVVVARNPNQTNTSCQTDTTVQEDN